MTYVLGTCWPLLYRMYVLFFVETFRGPYCIDSTFKRAKTVQSLKGDLGDPEDKSFFSFLFSF